MLEETFITDAALALFNISRRVISLVAGASRINRGALRDVWLEAKLAGRLRRRHQGVAVASAEDRADMP